MEQWRLRLDAGVDRAAKHVPRLLSHILQGPGKGSRFVKIKTGLFFFFLRWTMFDLVW